ncbi:hypothetical protein D779_2134 [Imhoffiella purpurea]|uniref:PilZ domain-containing protein n=2 Tax=Imhoffiella purpurea TaxID=1249627 RepID=W9VWE4_9GAMM|nr:hypothetical protein D779_2134 [Imhoffiella purpurea]
MHGTAQLSSPEHRSFVVYIVDISAGGVRVVAPINPRVGTVFVLRIRLPLRPSGSLPVETRVSVAHSILTGEEDGFVLGLTFLELPNVARNAILDYLLV